MANNCVIVTRSFFVQDAHVDKTRLELEGIRVFLWDENFVNLRPLLSPAVGGVKVVVHVRDAERAVQVLATRDPLFDSDDPEVAATLETLWFEDSVAELAAEEALKEERKNATPPGCPECGCAPAVSSYVPIQAVATVFALFFPWMLVAVRVLPLLVLFVAVLLAMFAVNNIARWRSCTDCGASWKI